MTARSIVEINVESEEFKEFQRLFKKYKEDLQKMPGDWSKVGQEADAAGKAAKKTMAGEAEEAGKVREQLDKAVKQQGEITRKAKESNASFKELARTTGTIATNVANTTFQLLKWAALGGIVGAAGGFFGISALTQSASNLRSQSQGLNVSPGELRSAQIHFGTPGYFDPNAVLGNINAAQMDPNKWGTLRALGIGADRQNQSPAQLLPDIIRNLVQMYHERGPAWGAFAKGIGADQIIDLPSIQRLANLPRGELESEISGFKRDISSVGIGDKTIRSLQKLQEQFDKAGDQIEKVFIQGLSKIAPQLNDLSRSIVKAIQTLFEGPGAGQLTEALGKGIEKTAKYLASDDFKTDMQSVVAFLGKSADALVSAAGDLRVLAHPILADANYFENPFSNWLGGVGNRLFGEGSILGPTPYADPAIRAKVLRKSIPPTTGSSQTDNLVSRVLPHGSILGPAPGTTYPQTNITNINIPGVPGLNSFNTMTSVAVPQ